VAAIAVLFTHAFVVAEGGQWNEPVVWLTDNQCPLGLIGVFVFFCISGYLVTQSWIGDPSPLRFALKRSLRIFPGLWVNLLVSACLIGPIVTHLTLAAYFADGRFWAFWHRNLLLELGGHPLPGVLFSKNSASDTVNGSLWTLRYELMMYGLVLLLGLARLIRLWLAILLIAIGIVAVQFDALLDRFGEIAEIAWFVGFFGAGIAFYRVRESGIWIWPVALAALGGLIVSSWMHLLIPLFPIFGGFLTFYVARLDVPWTAQATRFGDLSYGTYLYGWPVEQLVVYCHGGAASWQFVFLWSVPLSLLLAFLSWHLVERWAIRFSRLAPRQIHTNRERLAEW
jgi:peptidoglycan/LPS O-acetylase OafA/YrhL